MLINAQQAFLQTSLARVQADAARLADTVALFQALGGGWWNRPKAATISIAPGFSKSLLRAPQDDRLLFET